MARTHEPPPPRFVLLEHAWNGVHWDFMLERDGVLKTWAIDVPGETADARPLPDHRAAYLDYEGPISGDRGSVRRVDSGVYDAIQWADDLVRVRLRGAQLVGEVLLIRRPPDESRAPDRPCWKISLGNVDWRIFRDGSRGV